MPVFEEREDVAEIVHFLPVVEPGPPVDIEGDPVLAQGRKVIREIGPLLQQDRDIAVPGRPLDERMVRLLLVHGKRLCIDDAVDPPGHHIGLVPLCPGRIASLRGEEQFHRTGMTGAALGYLDRLVPELPRLLR